MYLPIRLRLMVLELMRRYEGMKRLQRATTLEQSTYMAWSLCWLRLGDGKNALSDAEKCRMIRPRWSKAWYRESAALSLLKNYKGAADAFGEALKLDPASDEIKGGH